MTLTKTSARQKGRDFEKQLISDILFYLNPKPEEIKRADNFSQGADIYSMGDLTSVFPFAIEAKRTETLRLNKALEQAKTNADKVRRLPLVVWKQSRKEAYVILSWRIFMSMCREMCSLQRNYEQK